MIWLGAPFAIPHDMQLDNYRRSTALVRAAGFACLLAACRLEHPPNPSASADSTGIGRALAVSAVPRLAPGTTAELRVDASRIGGSFASTFERELAPAVSYVRGDSRNPTEFVAVIVDSLTMALDSATAVVRDSSLLSATTLRIRMVPRVEGGWRVVSQEVLRHSDRTQPVILTGASRMIGQKRK